MHALCRIEMLGGLRIVRDDHVISRFRTQKTGALLAYLALYPRHPHSREVLCSLIWPESDSLLGRHSLSTSVSALRQALEPHGVPAGTILRADRTSVALNPDAVTIDVREFEMALEAGARSGSPTHQVPLLSRALEIYRGELLPGCYEDWCLVERERLAEAHRMTARQLVEQLRSTGQPDLAIKYARLAVDAAPRSEELQRLLMSLLDLPPAAPTTPAPPDEAPLPDALLAGSPFPAQSLPAPAQRDPVPRMGIIPPQFTHFFGRERELSELQEILDPKTHAGRSVGRLVTLSGPAGCGKSRLAIEVSARANKPGRLTARYVSLSEIEQVDQIPAAIVDALGISGCTPADSDPGAIECLARALSGQRMLLLLDGLERLVEGGAQLIQSLLQQAPDLVCLVTSRQRLKVAGEQEYRMAALPVPDPAADLQAIAGCPSVQVFLDRALAVQPAFQLNAGNAAAIAALCTRLEGLPLSLELAAMRLHLMTPAQMLSQIDQRFRLLVSQQRDLHPRHRSLKAALDWSYQLLPPPLQRYFARLSVFRGGWDLDAAEAVCLSGASDPDAIDATAELLAASLATASDAVCGVRFSMLETLREYAADQLLAEDRAECQARHAEYFLNLARQAGGCLHHRDQALCLDQLEMEQGNLGAALSFCLLQPEWRRAGLDLAGLLAGFWQLRGRATEGRQWLTKLLAIPDPEGADMVRARALQAAGTLALFQGDFGAAPGLLDKSLDIHRQLGDRQGQAASLMYLALCALHQGEPAAAEEKIQESLTIFQELDDRWGLARALSIRSDLAGEAGNLVLAASCLVESCDLLREGHDESGLALSLNNLGSLRRREENLPAARRLHQEALALYQKLGDKGGIAWSLANLGRLAEQEGDGAEAGCFFRQALALWQETGNRRGIAECLEGIAGAALQEGDPERAARLLGGAEALLVATGSQVFSRDLPGHEQRAAAITAACGDTAADARLEGRRMPLSALVQEASEPRQVL